MSKHPGGLSGLSAISKSFKCGNCVKLTGVGSEQHITGKLTTTSNSCNTGTSALPDMYARRPRASADISGNARVPVLQLICYTSGTLKICLNLLLTALSIYIAKDGHCDYGILILTFP